MSHLFPQADTRIVELSASLEATQADLRATQTHKVAELCYDEVVAELQNLKGQLKASRGHSEVCISTWLTHPLAHDHTRFLS